ncbi:hypothetical protein [Candidatus Aalborgicola defluviihabitans]|uniref:oxidoreductase n=1 Tax=Candidatus Aalborgicola defluviihabitans TaxID=3386187 RepID=UPI0039B82EB2
MQILHFGRYSYQKDLVAPSALQAPINPFTPHALSTEEVEQTIEDFARCAGLAQVAGYDGVEIMGSEGYLINEFIAARTNQRDDAWGGAYANHPLPGGDRAPGARSAWGQFHHHLPPVHAGLGGGQLHGG